MLALLKKSDAGCMPAWHSIERVLAIAQVGVCEEVSLQAIDSI
ncbi:MAG: hypothetical protein U0840_16935 [Gemmataceae bacterium]